MSEWAQIKIQESRSMRDMDAQQMLDVFMQFVDEKPETQIAFSEFVDDLDAELGPPSVELLLDNSTTIGGCVTAQFVALRDFIESDSSLMLKLQEWVRAKDGE